MVGAIDVEPERVDALEGLGEAAAYRQLEDAGDGLPVAAPRTDLVDRMVGAMGLADDEVVAAIPPLRQPLTARRLAICAALAGCEPHHAPVLVGAFKAFADPGLNAYGFLTTTGSAAPMLIVSGPAAGTLGFSGGANCLGPGCRANATVGRCVSLVVRLVGGARAGLGDMATLGQPAKFSCCFAEHESASPWAPLHVDRGFPAASNAVTVTAISGIVETFESTTGQVEDMLDALAVVLVGCAPTMDLGVEGPIVGGGQPIVVITPEWAAQFDRQGVSKAALRGELFERAVRPRAAGEALRVARHVDDVLIVVAGGVGVKQAILPNWNGGSRAVTVPFGAA